VTAQLAKVRRGLDALEADCPHFPIGLDIGAIAIARALAYLDLRYADEEWRIGHPSLAAWFDPIGERPSMVATTPPT
jgi:glutathione S-transferase